MSTYKRIEILDSLRGFALLGAVLIQFVGHFDLSAQIENHVIFSSEIDNKVRQLVYFMISGKALLIFALLFGFSFYLQMQVKDEKSGTITTRFIWRMVVLFIIGCIQSTIYKGDILQIFAISGILLILLNKLPSKVLVIIAILLTIQIPIISNLVLSFVIKDFQYLKIYGQSFWEDTNKVYVSGSLLDVINFNLWKGRIIMFGWMFYDVKYTQMMAFFISGMLLGRVKFLKGIEEHLGLYIKILIMCILFVILFEFMNKSIMISEYTDSQKYLISLLIYSWSNQVFTLVLILIFLILYLKHKNSKTFNLLAIYGQMSLSNYIFQTIIGVGIFYGFGLGLYKSAGAIWSLLIGFILIILQLIVNKLWIQYFNYGPIEWLWRALISDFKIRFKKDKNLSLH